MDYRISAIALLAVLAVPCTQAAEPVPDSVREVASGLIPGTAPDRVAASPIAGLFEVTFGPKVFYISSDGGYLVNGDVIDLRAFENITEETRKRARVEAIESLGEDSMIVFAPDDVKSTITVFTDVTCGYCAQLHREVDQLNRDGVEVRYLAYPRSGVASPVYDQMVSVWCADDPHQAMTDAKSGVVMPPRQCDNPVAEHYAMGQLVGVQGTPTIVLQDGSVLGGYVPSDQLSELAQQAAGG